MNYRAKIAASALPIAMVMAGCSYAPPEEPAETEPAVTQGAATDEPKPISIIRDDVEIEREDIRLDPLEQRIGFEDGGRELSETALETLAGVLDTPQFKAGGPIALRGHTDSAGFDEANLRASQRRADAVGAWLIDNGVAEERITVIAMGEQNPAKPNAKPDGAADEEARAFNRRVDLTIAVPSEIAADDPESEEPNSLIERVAAEAEAKD